MRPRVWIGISSSAIPILRPVDISTRYRKLVESVRLTKPSVVPIMMIRPIIASHLAPNRSNSLPVTGISSPIISAPGSSSRPDSSAV
ncbi:hypothetical protein D3C73_1455290 [compost metagenome]